MILKSFLLDVLVIIARLLGVATSVVLFGIGFDVAFHNYEGGICIMIGSLIVFVLETSWVVTTFMNIFYHPTNNICWEVFINTTRWPKALSYIIAAWIFILHPHRLWLYTVAGVMLLLIVLSDILLSLAKRPVSETKATLLHAEEYVSDENDLPAIQNTLE